MGESKNSPRRVNAKMRRDKALALRIAGATYEQIARTRISEDDPRPLYTSRQRAHEAVDEALKELKKESDGKSAELRTLELARLDSMHLALWPLTRPTRPVKCPECEHVIYREPDQGAVDRVIRIQERRSKFEGLDAADQNEDRMVAVLEHQVALTQRAMVRAMERAGIGPAQQREVLEYAAEFLREDEDEDAP